MSIKVLDTITTFAKIDRGLPFAAITTLYSRTDGAEQPKKQLFYKINQNKAITVDKKTFVHFLPDQIVNICSMIENKRVNKPEIAVLQH